MKRRAPLLTPLVVLLLAACGTSAPKIERAPAPPPPAAAGEAAKPAPTKKPALKYGGGYYKDDGPGDDIPDNLDSLPDATPRLEPLHRGAVKPYTVLGRSYVPNTRVQAYKARGIASWYGKKFHGQKTSIGEAYDMFAMTAAHTTLALPSYVRVSNPANGRSVVVRVTDRGPFHPDRIIDLSYAAAHKLGFVNNGSSLVEVEAIVPGGVDERLTVAQVPPPERPPARADSDELGELLARSGTEATPLPPPAATEAVPKGPAVWLQLGAFANPDNAESTRVHLARELDWIGLPFVLHAGPSVQRVQVGPFASRAEAEKAAERIRGEYGTKPALVLR